VSTTYEVWQDGVLMVSEQSLEKAKGYYFRYKQEGRTTLFERTGDQWKELYSSQEPSA
jgi:hypothetical protein